MRFGAGMVSVAMALPLAWAMAASITPEGSLFEGASKIGGGATLEHYAALFRERRFLLPIRNSLIVGLSTTLLAVTFGSLCAYSLARLRFPARRILLGLVLAISMFPQISVVSPVYLLLRTLGLVDTHAGLVLPYLTFALPIAIWLLSSYFRSLPLEMEQAALMDGATRFRAFWEITLPLSIPGLWTTSIITFIYCWNEFLFALAFTVSEDRHTVPVALALFRGQHRVPWGEIFAASVVASVPVAALVLVFQRRIVQGLTSGAVKG